MARARKFKRVTNDGAIVTVEWGYELHSLKLTPRNWARITAGKPLRVRGKGYHYEGEFFWDYWDFAGGLDGWLQVTYGEGLRAGVGFEGTLHHSMVEVLDGSSSNPGR